MDFYTQYKRPEKSPEVLGGPVLVEQEGYIPAKEQIESMFTAGRRLMAGRGYFEFGPEGEIPDDYQDPTRDPNFDRADASQIEHELLTRDVLEDHADGVGNAGTEDPMVPNPPAEPAGT
nr:MAG: hypothetical protein [Microvirus sp.]